MENTKINERSENGENKVSEENKNFNERSGNRENKVSGEKELGGIELGGIDEKIHSEELYLPTEVQKANWRDDVSKTAEEIDEEIGFEPFEDEQEYELRDEQIHDLERFEEAAKYSEVLKRAKAQKVGLRVLEVYRKAA